DKYVIVTDNQYHANELYDELTNLVEDEKVYQFFSDDNVYAEFAIASKDRTAYRLEALNFLLDTQQKGFLVVPFMALRSLLPHPDNFQENYLLLTQGDEFEMTSLLEILASAGYEKTQRVMVPGEFSQRGDIVDIYPLDAAQPL
ncbi:TPA: transcription-repair coupling factor, partial [Streptococcus pyogenes]